MKIKMSFIMIVLNGLPYIEAVLKSIYKAAYEIIIVEGAERKCMFAANLNGSSKDGTVQFIKKFPDSNKKIRLIQGRWYDKCAMQNKAMEFVKGNYVWLVDSDEVYKKDEIIRIFNILRNRPNVYQVTIPIIHFWKGCDYILDSKEKPRNEIQRIFKIVHPCHFTTHRPPSLLIKKFGRFAQDIKIMRADFLKAKGIYCYHYSYITSEQVKQKVALYKNYGWEKPWKLDLNDWYKNCFLKWTPKNRTSIESKYRIIPCDRKSKTKRFTGIHPESVKGIMKCKHFK